MSSSCDPQIRLTIDIGAVAAIGRITRVARIASAKKGSHRIGAAGVGTTR